MITYQRGSWNRNTWGLSKESTVHPAAKIADEWLGPKIQRIKMASGEAFVAGEQARKMIQSETQCQMVDMNSFGFALACQKAGVPYLILRVVSDKADNDASDSFRKFVAGYDGSMGAILRKLITEKPVSKESPSAYENIQKILDE